VKLWRLSYHDDDSPSGSVSEWFTAKRAALTRAAALRAEFTGDDGRPLAGFFIDEGDPRAVEVPTKRAELAAFLTQYDP
jgi:hypothetical protein